MDLGFADIARQRPLLSSFLLPGPLLFAPNIPSGALPPNPRDLPHGGSSGRSRPRGLTPPGTCRMLAAGSARVASLQSPVLCCGTSTSVAVGSAPVLSLRSGYYSGFIRTNLSGFDRTTSGFDRTPTVRIRMVVSSLHFFTLHDSNSGTCIPGRKFVSAHHVVCLVGGTGGAGG